MGRRPTATEAAAVDAQAAGPGTGDAADEHRHEHGARRAGDPYCQTDHEQGCDGELDPGQGVAEWGDEGLGQDLVRPDGTNGGGRIADLGDGGVAEDAG